jgi:hypothetical protein
MWERIKKILQKEGGKCIIVEKDQSTYLVMKLEDYEESSNSNLSEIEEVNRNIAGWKSEQREKEQIETHQLAEEEVKIEDLPF